MIRRSWVALLAISLVACSFAMKGPPPGHEQMTRIECSESIARPVLDIVGGVLVTFFLFLVAAIASWGASAGGESSGEGFLIAPVASLVLFAAAATTGFQRAGQCEAAKRALAVRLAVGSTVAAAMAPTAAAAVTPGQAATREPSARPPVGDTVAATRAPSAAVAVPPSRPAADTGQRRTFTIEISGTKDTLAVGERLQLLASARSPSGDPLANLSYWWTSSNSMTATVGLAGRVSAVAPGLVTITAHAGAVTKSVNIVIIAR
jgi:hypothetical protein